MLKHIFGKYRFLVLSISLFLIFDLGVLVLNFYTSGQIAKQTEQINLAARQRTLTQQLSKATLYIKSQKLLQWPYQSGLDELENHYETFGQTLASFNNGGEVKSTETGQPITISPVQTKEGRELLKQANSLWSGFEKSLSPLMVDILVTDEEIDPASAYIARYNVPMFNIMNDLTNHFKQTSDQQTTFLRRVQVIGISLATINFFIILFHFLRQLKNRDHKIELAKHESDQILATIDEGVFLVDKDMNIGQQHSDYLKKIFNTNHISKRNFIDFLSSYLSTSTVETAADYLKLFFTAHVNTDLVEDINPLNNVKASIIEKDKTVSEKYLSFSFAQLRQEDNDDAVLVSVKDVTDSVKLEQQTRKSENNSQQQMSMLVQILPIDPDLLSSFINDSESVYQKINQRLKQAKHKKENYQTILDDIYQRTHQLKGNASTLGVEWIATQLHKFEDALDEIRNQSSIRGSDFLPLTISLRELIESNIKIQTMVEKLQSYGQAQYNLRLVHNQKNTVVEQKWENLRTFTEKTAKQYGQQVDVSFRGLDTPINRTISDNLYDISTQLVRNSIAHSLEPTHIRKKLLKPVSGQIQMTLSSNSNGQLRFIYQDDGKGFDFEKIRHQLIKQKLVDQVKVDALTKSELIKWTFKNQFSTKQDNDQNAGRGVGLALVQRLVNDNNGKINVRFLQNEITQFVFEFPHDDNANKLAS